MRKSVFAPGLALAVLLAASTRVDAAVISFQGTFSTDDQVKLFNFSVAAPGTVTLQTFGYAGGINGNGMAIARGGFDPILTLFDSLGNFLNSNKDGPCGKVGKDSVTLNCFDSYISQNLGAGSYQVALTENDNLPVGPTLANSFTEVGKGNFTCPLFLGTPGSFCDSSPSHRTNAFALDIVTPGGPGGVPEPASALLLLTGAALLAFRKRS